ncbi:hypothetical protein L1987_13649 [Smallanthus sonchifolius]|uniref:Uncharacterized protein n=1 Tax=Smallanthus sonchifolius TaxID=185202 RepID=A0ACB9JI47_9ASTR|nr:hypothetical protein L1987_13649 [Smallanthus sonchifolius]
MIASKGKGKTVEQEQERPRKKAKHSQVGMDEDILHMLSEAAKREIGYLISQVIRFKNREDDREMEITELITMVVTQKKVIDGQQKSLESMFGMITELYTKLNMSQEISWDYLFEYSGFHVDVGGEGSSGLNIDVQGSSGLKDKEPLDMVDKDEEGDKEKEDDVEGGD